MKVANFVLARDDTAPLDPNDIPVSPSGSALQRLSIYEPPPSVVTSESQSSRSLPPRPPSAPVPPIESIPDIPDFNSKSSKHPAPPAQQTKQSKLSLLASSRANTQSRTSLSSRTSAVDSSSSVTTYPALRPTSKSMRPASPLSASSTSSHIRRAIQTAIELEAEDRSVTPTNNTISPVNDPTESVPTIPSPSTPTAPEPRLPVSTASQPSGRRPSKLALLAKAKAQTHQGPRTPKPKTPVVTAYSGSNLPPPRTEYLTPIANGPTATTAITTSYQSLYSLTSPMSPPSSGGHFLPLTPLAEPKLSKLALKIKKGQEGSSPVYSAIEDPLVSPTSLPIFLPKATHPRALPSAFASLLIDDRLMNPEDELTSKYHDKKKGKMKTVGESRPSAQAKEKSKHKHHTSTTPHLRSNDFSFDVPSPDDIVFHARRGTSMAKGSLASSPGIPSPGKASRF